jgi:phage gpG-like protein
VANRRSGWYSRRSSTRGARGGAVRGDAIRIAGLAEFRRDLKKIDEGLTKELTKYLRQIAAKTQREAQALAPVGKPYVRNGKQHRPGTLKRSIKRSVTTRQMSLYSNLDYAPAHEWGTTAQGDSRVQPKGVPIKIRRRQMLGKAVLRRRPEMEEELLEMVDHLARINGFDD